ncbi:retrovirus-related pol polyprotein from transposon tnt 1-94 [Nicotiana attenuata]|uniref:Retrovirus-related pol polyprotein from transposon tnt 1-94 n=1 Tax=Nicotiana attenuata TaxID=49451 RepID=A0A314KGU3_NICAT|nr:retrovirus-related pol polyprotein from transposon tnt 1-94 [Nicotiana attenuata]
MSTTPSSCWATGSLSKILDLCIFLLDVEVILHSDGLLLTQSNYIAELLDKFHMLEANGVATPMSTSEHLSINDGSCSADVKQYRQVIGSLQYLSFTRPDICFTINKLAQFQHASSIRHWQAAKRFLRYLKEILTYGLLIRPSSTTILQAYSDADWGGMIDTRHSTSDYVILLGSNPITVAGAVAEVNWIVNLLKELHLPPKTPPKILCDNVGATYLSRNPFFHSRMKHVAIDFHFVRDQLVDALTKPLPRRPFSDFVTKIGFQPVEPILRGHDKDKDKQS